jgi:hypothetical protein
LACIERLTFIRQLHIPIEWVGRIHQNRLVQIAREGTGTDAAHPRSFSPERRYATLRRHCSRHSHNAHRRDAGEKHVFTSEGIDRRFYETCVLSELGKKLRAGDLWVVGSRRYKDF